VSEEKVHSVKDEMSKSAPYRPTLLSSQEWINYKSEPNGATLGALLATVPVEQRSVLIAAMEELFFDHEYWRVSQHLVMLHLNRFPPDANRR
jgi:hypothetical protein